MCLGISWHAYVNVGVLMAACRQIAKAGEHKVAVWLGHVQGLPCICVVMHLVNELTH